MKRRGPRHIVRSLPFGYAVAALVAILPMEGAACLLRALVADDLITGLSGR